MSMQREQRSTRKSYAYTMDLRPKRTSMELEGEFYQRWGELDAA